MAELVAEHLSFGFGSRPLLRDVNITLCSGEMLVCLGANATGKTTLLRLLSGLLIPTSGNVYVRDSAKSSPHGKVGMLFQNPDQQMIAATVEEEIALGLEMRGVETQRIREIVDKMVTRFQLEYLRHHPPQALSGGQKQRVALAAIMAAKPGFLLLDEPDSFLDAPSRRELLEGIAEVRTECGVLWTAPDPRRLPYGDRYLLLQDGVLIEHSRDQLALETDSVAS